MVAFSAALRAVAMASFLLQQTCHGRVFVRESKAPPDSESVVGPRNVTLVIDTTVDQTEVNHNPEGVGGVLMKTHAFLEWSTGPNSPAFRLEMLSERLASGEVIPAIRGLERAGPNSGYVGVQGRYGADRKQFPLGESKLSNSDILNPTTGKGIAADAWGQDPVYRTGGGGAYNAGLTFIQRVVKTLDSAGVRLPPTAAKLLDLGIEYGKKHGPPSTQSVTKMFYDRQAGDGLTVKTRADFDLKGGDPRSPVFKGKAAGPKDPPIFADTPKAPTAVKGGLVEGIPVGKVAQGIPAVVDGYPVDGEPKNPRAPVGKPSANGVPTMELSGAKGQIASAATRDGVMLARTAGTMATVMQVGKAMLKGAVVAGAIASPIFVILDLVAHDFVGAAFGAIGILAGTLIAFAVEGPVGWVIGGLAAIFFAILPGLFKKKKEKPKGDDAAKIIQWVMFGDARHTGNEKCRDKGNKDCVALFGPGVIANTFKWPMFDAFIFLIEFNDGYAMSITDMAKALHIINPFKGDHGDNATATIDCQKKKESDKWCTNPVFAIKRERIQLPQLEATADQIVKRIIPEPGGDCKMVTTSANGIFYPNYNVTVHGHPSSIACGLTAALDVSGQAVALNNSNAVGNNADIAPLLANPSADETSDNSGQGLVAAPPALGFNQLSIADNVACVVSDLDATRMCFPNGLYGGHMDGTWGWDMNHATEVYLPPGAMLVLGHSNTQIRENKTSAEDEKFGDTLANFSLQKDRFSVNMLNASEPTVPVACLYDDYEYKGNVACFGAGGGDLPKAIQGKAKSMSVHGDALAWVYPSAYGDAGGVYITTDTPDFSVLPFGAAGNFSQKAKAMWVRGEKVGSLT